MYNYIYIFILTPSKSSPLPHTLSPSTCRAEWMVLLSGLPVICIVIVPSVISFHVHFLTICHHMSMISSMFFPGSMMLVLRSFSHRATEANSPVNGIAIIHHHISHSHQLSVHHIFTPACLVYIGPHQCCALLGLHRDAQAAEAGFTARTCGRVKPQLPMNCVNKGYNIFRPLIGHEYHCRMHCEQGTWRHVCVIPMDLIPK